MPGSLDGSGPANALVAKHYQSSSRSSHRARPWKKGTDVTRPQPSLVLQGSSFSIVFFTQRVRRDFLHAVSTEYFRVSAAGLLPGHRDFSLVLPSCRGHGHPGAAQLMRSGLSRRYASRLDYVLVSTALAPSRDSDHSTVRRFQGQGNPVSSCVTSEPTTISMLVAGWDVALLWQPWAL